VDNICRNTPRIEPSHLEVVTPGEMRRGCGGVARLIGNSAKRVQLCHFRILDTGYRCDAGRATPSLSPLIGRAGAYAICPVVLSNQSLRLRGDSGQSTSRMLLVFSREAGKICTACSRQLAVCRGPPVSAAQPTITGGEETKMPHNKIKICAGVLV
jgi:hypothetical protein